jgi:NADPH2:quinone reductase
MKWIRIYAHGAPDVMRYEDAPIPEPAPGQVRLKVAAAGVNYIDTYQRVGAYKMALPFTPGQEASGVVDAVGEGVTLFTPGDHAAFGFGVGGGYAEYVLVPEAKLVAVPPGIDLQVAAAVMLQGMTAHYLTHDTFALKPGDKALIHAAAGGTGQLVVQMAKMRGATVVGTVGSAAKAEIARSLGADHVINYNEQDFEAEVKRLVGSVDVVYDSVGATTFDNSLNCLRPRGCLVLFGQSSGAVPPFDPQILNAKGSLFFTRPSLGHYTATREELLYRAGDLFAAIQSGALRVGIERAFPLAQAAQAHDTLTSRAIAGKIILLPA